MLHNRIQLKFVKQEAVGAVTRLSGRDGYIIWIKTLHESEQDMDWAKNKPRPKAYFNPSKKCHHGCEKRGSGPMGEQNTCYGEKTDCD